MKVALLVAPMVVASLLVLATTMHQASALDAGEIAVDSKTTGVNNYVSVDLRAADVGPPGVGAWALDIAYDATVVSLSGCLANYGSICLLDYQPDVVRVTGASASGLQGDFSLATLVFRCAKTPGTTGLDLVAESWGDATIGFPPPPPEPVDGSITCLESGPASVPTATPSATPSVVELPSTGSGASGSAPLLWPIILAAFGAASLALALVAAAALRRRA